TLKQINMTQIILVNKTFIHELKQK
ncbi:hypothetical protein A5848_000045, partial [Enterococcus faecium]